MKLAEALQERADLNRKIEELKTRMMNNALVQEGEEPAEDPNDLLKEFDSAVKRLAVLMAEINHTNCETVVDGKSLTEMIAEKDALNVQLSGYRNLIDRASARADRYTRTEIKILSAVDVKSLQKKADNISKKLRELDNSLQAANWTTDLIEK